MICGGGGCNCAIVSDSLEVSGSGQAGDPWHLETNAFAVVTSTTRPSSPFVGQHIFETDRRLEWTWTGSEWVVTGGVTPMCVLSAGEFAVPNGGSGVFVPWETVTSDDFGWGDVGGSQPTRVTPDLSGWYEVTSQLRYEAADYTRNMVDVWRSGSLESFTIGRTDTVIDSNSLEKPITLVSVPFFMNGTDDYIQIRAYQNRPDTNPSNVKSALLALKFLRSD